MWKHKVYYLVSKLISRNNYFEIFACKGCEEKVDGLFIKSFIVQKYCYLPNFSLFTKLSNYFIHVNNFFFGWNCNLNIFKCWNFFNNFCEFFWFQVSYINIIKWFTIRFSCKYKLSLFTQVQCFYICTLFFSKKIFPSF